MPVSFLSGSDAKQADQLPALVERLNMKAYGPEIAELVAAIVAHSRLGHDKYTKFMDLGGLSALLQLVVSANVKVL